MTRSLWPRLRRQLERQLDPDEFATWFRPLRVRAEAPGRLVLLAPNARFLHTLEESYRPAVDRAIADLDDPAIEVLFSLAGGDEAEAAGRRAPAAAEESPARPAVGNGASFDPRYVFDTFVVGTSNEFAHAAARAVAERPSRSYNPLFLYGGVGLGKTHLLHAIGHHIQRQQPRLRVMYLVAEQFVNELINSIRFDRMPAFRERYRTIDVLLIDDIQFIAGKERTQEEFFHTFNTLYTSQKQIILSSDSSPRQIPTLEERLRSRFEWGLIADIQPPELETKEAILHRKAELEGVALPDEVAHFIARRVRSNIRELEGLLNRVIAFSMLTGKPLSPALAKETLKDILPEDGRRISGQEIVKQVAKHYGLKVSEIKSRSNSRQVAFPRQVAMYLCKRLTDLSYPEIGKLFNDKHHSTVMYSVSKIEELRESDRDLDRALQTFQERLAL
jgi:chromosomal replication initiator protein